MTITSRLSIARRLTFACLLLLAAGSRSQAGTLAQFRTIYGDLEVELYDQEKPVTTANFKRLVETGKYQNTFFHRVVPGFVVQGGGYLTASKNIANLFGPPWSYVGYVQNFGPITNEFGVGPFLSNTNGTLAMAKSPNDPNSATSQWFFNLSDNSASLDNQNGGFTVFGRVVRDTGPGVTGGLLGLFNLVSYSNGVVDLSWWYPTDPFATNLFTQLPITDFTNPPPQPKYSDLFYVDITLLSVQIALTNDMRQISWNSVNGLTNIVEYTTNLPPVWNTLTTTNGTGSRMAVTDPTATNNFRFYRVRVLY